MYNHNGNLINNAKKRIYKEMCANMINFIVKEVKPTYRSS